MLTDIKLPNFYQAFFIAIAVGFIGFFMGTIGIILTNEHTVLELILIIPICTLFATAVMMNIGNQSPTAKDVFWGWIIMTAIVVGFTTISSFTLLLIL